jgi:hypothetical protein
MERLKFPGVPVYMNGRNYAIPSLSTRQYRDFQSILENPPAPDEGEKAAAYLVRVADAFIPVIGTAIRRNYPEVTDDELADWLDGTTLMEAWKATQGASGMKPVTEGEEAPATAEPTGDGSTVK